MAFAVIGIELQRLVVMSDGFLGLSFLEQVDGDVIVSHPALGVRGDCRRPKRVRVRVYFALLPGQYPKGHQQCARKGRPDYRAPTSQKFPGMGETSRSQRQGSDAREVLVMVGDKGVTKGVKHDKAEHGAQRCGEI